MVVTQGNPDLCRPADTPGYNDAAPAPGTFSLSEEARTRDLWMHAALRPKGFSKQRDSGILRSGRHFFKEPLISIFERPEDARERHRI